MERRMSYKDELRDCYLAPEGSRSVNEWMDMLFHGNQSDCDIMELIAERDILREQLNIAVDTIGKLLSHLPDSIHKDDESWGWFWNELDGDAQDAIKTVRVETQTALAEIRKLKND
jgi:hypothetical protein